MARDKTIASRFLIGAALFLALLQCPAHGAVAQDGPAATGDIVVTLLGTGGPEPSLSRFGPATLVQAGGLSLLFDAGRGVTVRLYQLGMPSGKGIDGVLPHPLSFRPC